MWFSTLTAYWIPWGALKKIANTVHPPESLNENFLGWSQGMGLVWFGLV